MALDPRFIVTSDLEEYFVDKDTGAPLSGGIVTFYSDPGHTVLKPVYQLSGSYDVPIYTALPNPVILSSVGTFQYLGNNIVPYYFPYEGIPSDNSSNIELYYITIENSNNVLEFTRDFWPNFTSSDIQNTEFQNFIPNGQFLFHNDNPVSINKTINSVNYTISEIAQGGWQFVKNTASTSVYSISFNRQTSEIPALNGYARYLLDFDCTTFNVANDTVRDIRINWPDVNKFQNFPDSPNFTFFFGAQSTDGTNHSIQIRIIKNYGTGGDPQDDIFVSNLNISTTFQYYGIVVNFGNNSGKNIGLLDDDFVALAIRGPQSTFKLEFTDFGLGNGNIPIGSTFTYPIETNAQMLSEGISGWMPTPNPDGSDLYLPLRLSPTGLEFDHSTIGKIEPTIENITTSISTTTNEILCDGSEYFYNDYSTLGIPFKRLGDVLFDSSINMPITGTGKNFATTYILDASSDSIFFTTNQFKLVTEPSDVSTTFTFSRIHLGDNSGYGYRAGRLGPITLIVISNFITSPNAINAFMDAAGPQATGFTFLAPFKDQNGAGANYFSQAFSVMPAGALIRGAGVPAKYFAFRGTDASSAALNFYVWFNVTGEIDPGPIAGLSGIEVRLNASDNNTDVANILSWVLQGGQQTSITAVPFASIPANSYWTFQTPDLQNYLVWYNKDHTGTAPVIVGSLSIEVVILTGDSATQIALKTIQAINKFKYGVPDLRGTFLRGKDPTAIWDLNVNDRFSLNGALNGSNLATFELDTFYSHNHVANNVVVDAYLAGANPPNMILKGNTGGPAQNFNFPVVVNFSGNNETRPINTWVNFIIKY